MDDLGELAQLDERQKQKTRPIIRSSFLPQTRASGMKMTRPEQASRRRIETTRPVAMLMRHKIFSLLITASAMASPAALAQDVDICPSCETELKLSLQEWHCLADDIELYYGVSSNPVLVSLYGCGTKSKIEDKNRNTQVDIVITPQKNAKDTIKEPYKAAFRLSKSQIGCLRKKLKDILPSPPESFNFSRDCKS